MSRLCATCGLPATEFPCGHPCRQDTAKAGPRYVSVDGKDYTVHLGANGQPERVEVGSYSYKGRLVLREVKRDGAAWKRAVKALKLPLTACPHCGGLNGYFTTQRRTVSRLHEWHGQGEADAQCYDADDLQVVGESRPRCLDCKKPVPVDLSA